MNEATSTEERIVRAARHLLMTRGYNGFSYADVSESVGIRKASIHHHFPAKSDLALAVIEASRRTIAGHADALATQDLEPFAELRLYTGHWERCILDGSDTFCVAAMLAAELPTLSPELASAVQGHFREVTGWFERVLTRGAREGKLRLVASPRVEADSLLSVVYGAMLTARARRDPAAFVAIVEGALAKLAPITLGR